MKRISIACAAALLAAVVLVATPIVAIAQAVASTTIDAGSIFGAWKPYIVELAGIAVAAIVGLLAELVRRVFGLAIERQHRDALQTALTNAAGLALNKLGNTLDGKVIDVKNVHVAAAVDYVSRAAPAALAKFGLGPHEIAERILAKLPQVANTTTTATPPAA